MLNFKKILITAICLSGIFANTVVFAKDSQLILFYADWHAKTKEAQSLCRKIVEDFGLNYQEFNIDNIKNVQKAKKLDIKIPKAIPYIYIFDHKGNVVYKKSYKSSSLNQIEQEIKKYLD